MWHPPEIALELYAIRKLREPDLALIEEHLLTCDGCRAEVELADVIRGAPRSKAVSSSR
jgi:hypothetical protein